MTRTVAFLQPGWADWEAGPALALLREYFEAEVSIATPDGKAQTSIGGLTATADTSFADVKVDDADVFLVIGSSAWPDYHDGTFFALLRDALAKNKIVGAICAGTVAAARAGLFEGREHTSNERDWLAMTAPGYAGADLYQETPGAVTSGRLVSAPGRAPFTFSAGIARLVAPQAADAISGYEQMCAAEWGRG